MNTTDFLMKGSAQSFSKVLKHYNDALKMKSALKKQKNGENLEQLDEWYQEKLGKLALSRAPPHITGDELVRLMKWKLARGKFRPRLVELASSNSEEVVRSASKKGIALASKKKVGEAINALVVLKGVGPATASGILAACVPENCCFFADEVAHAIPSLASLKYNATEYEVLNSLMIDCTQRLNTELEKSDEKENDKEEWTPHKVELAVWTHSIIKQNKPELLPDEENSKRSSEGEDSGSKKRKRT